MPELEAMVQDLAVRAQVPVPRLYLIPSEQPNAFATGRNPQHAAVAVTEGLLQHLPPDQVKGVLAHEFAHIKNRDILVMSIAAMVSGAIAAIANIMQFSLLFGGDDDDSPLGLVGTLAAIIVAPLAATLLQLAVSRQREYLADATGAQLLGQAKPLADGLETLERGAQALPMRPEPGRGLALRGQPAAARRHVVAVHDAPADRRAHPPAAGARRRPGGPARRLAQTDDRGPAAAGPRARWLGSADAARPRLRGDEDLRAGAGARRRELRDRRGRHRPARLERRRQDDLAQALHRA